jgi:dTDP-4-dehydrorhamnose reductase
VSKRSVLATGATGLVGSRFVELYEAEYDVANMDLTTGVDITDRESIRQFVADHPSETLIHLAAFTDTNAAFAQTGDKSGLCYRVNVEGTENIAAACREAGIHLIHVSTDFVFDGTKDTPYTEDDPRSPIEWYGKTKAMAEEVVEESGVGYTIVRIAYPYRQEFAAKPDLIKKIRTGLEAGHLYPQFSDSTITPTYVDDIARGFAKLVEDKSHGLYHFVGSTSLSPYELARQIATAFGFDPNVVKKGSLTEYLQTASRPFARHVAMSNSKAQKDLGLTFATLAEGLAAVS